MEAKRLAVDAGESMSVERVAEVQPQLVSSESSRTGVVRSLRRVNERTCGSPGISESRGVPSRVEVL
jgi:hypothetical protein